MGFLRTIIPDNSPIRLLYHKLNAMIASIYYGFPANNMIVVGVTGTKGKTTTSNIIVQLLESNLERVGLISTAVMQIGPKKWINSSKMSSPSPWVIQKMLKDMLNDGCTYAILEVTSHAITQSRYWGVNFDYAVLTNLAEDHIEYHGSVEEYHNTKKKLFQTTGISPHKANKRKKTIILNADDKIGSIWEKIYADRTILYSRTGKSAGVYASGVISHAGNSEFILHLPTEKIKIKLALQGQFNVSNALAAISVAFGENIEMKKIKTTLANLQPIPGRMEKINAGQNYPIFVDYAHTTDSLDEALGTLHISYPDRRLVVVFGSTGGGRDKAKRPKMAAAAEKHSDVIILTDDDPYTENNLDIIHQIQAGLSDKMIEGENLYIIPNRKEAITYAITTSTEKDLIVVAGKGCETVQAIGDELIPYSDSQIIHEVISDLTKISKK